MNENRAQRKMNNEPNQNKEIRLQQTRTSHNEVPKTKTKTRTKTKTWHNEVPKTVANEPPTTNNKELTETGHNEQWIKSANQNKEIRTKRSTKQTEPEHNEERKQNEYWFW